MAYSDTIIEASPMAYWRYNEFSGLFTFDEISGFPLSYQFLNGGIVTQQQQGLINDPNFSVEIQNAYVRAIVPFNYSAPGSFEIWFRTSLAITDFATLLTNYNNDNDWSFRLRTISLGGQIVLEANTTQGLISIPAQGINFNDGGTYHIVMTYDGQTLFLYVNGLVRGAATNITVVDALTDYFSIGNEYFGDISTQYNGFIDEASFYGYSLTASMVQQHYSAGINPPEFITKGGVFASLIDVSQLSINPKLTQI